MVLNVAILFWNLTTSTDVIPVTFSNCQRYNINIDCNYIILLVVSVILDFCNPNPAIIDIALEYAFSRNGLLKCTKLRKIS
jgi:hypothetical protein